MLTYKSTTKSKFLLKRENKNMEKKKGKKRERRGEKMEKKKKKEEKEKKAQRAVNISVEKAVRTNHKKNTRWVWLFVEDTVTKTHNFLNDISIWFCFQCTTSKRKQGFPSS